METSGLFEIDAIGFPNQSFPGPHAERWLITSTCDQLETHSPSIKNRITFSELNTRQEEEIELFHDKINIPGLVDICIAKRETAVICCISEPFTCGTENVLKEIVFEDGVIWVARLPIK